MDKEEMIKFLEDRLEAYKKSDPQAFNLLNAYERVIQDLYSE